MFEDRERQNQTEQSQKDRNVYFGVITDLLEETTTLHLPLSFGRSPPWIQLHLHTSHLFIISPFSPGLLLLRLCLAVSSHPPPPHPRHLSPSLSLHSIKIILVICLAVEGGIKRTNSCQDLMLNTLGICRNPLETLIPTDPSLLFIGQRKYEGRKRSGILYD